MQSGNPIQAPAHAPAGGTVEVQVESSVSQIWVQLPGEDYVLMKVPKSGKVTLDVPNTPGEIIEVNVRRGGSVVGVSIVIVAPTP